MTRIAVLGGSNGGYAMAADLSIQGHEVFYYVRNPEHHGDVLRRSEIDMYGVLGDGTARLSLASTDLEEVLAAAEIVFVPLPSFTHKPLLNDMTPLLKDGHIVVFTPGTLLSSLMGATMLKQQARTVDVVFCESATLPYGTRRMGPSKVSINCAVTYNPLGVLPATKSDEVFPLLQAIYPTFLAAADVLDAALNNQSPITQPAGMVLNTGYVENVKDFHLHRDGVTPSVLRVEEHVDSERVALRRALGYSKPDYPMKEFYVPGSTDDRALFSGVIAEVNESIDYEEFYDTYMPYEGVHHRYLNEACGEGLVFISALSRTLGLNTPISDAVITLASIVSEVDYFKEGRTPASVGLQGADSEDIRRLLSAGPNTAAASAARKENTL